MAKLLINLPLLPTNLVALFKGPEFPSALFYCPFPIMISIRQPVVVHPPPRVAPPELETFGWTNVLYTVGSAGANLQIHHWIKISTKSL